MMDDVAFPLLFSPVQVGTMALRNRVMMPPHGSAIGNLWGTDADAERNIAYWQARAEAGVAWIDGVSGHIDGRAIPGFMEQVARIGTVSVTTRNIYSGRETEIDGIDSVVFACGSQSDSALHDELRPRHPAAHVLGDAYAPRRLVFATRQAYALARELAA